MQLGFNTNGLQNHRLEDALHLLADNGYTAVALTLDVQHLDPFRCGPADVDRAARVCEHLGLQVVIETGARFLLDPARKHEPTLMSRDAGRRALRLEFYSRAAEIGARLGAEVVSFWSGIDREPGAGSWSWLCEGVSLACRAIRARGLTPALEPEPGMLVASMADFERLRVDLGAEAPALTLDVGHLLVTEREPPEEVIPRFARSLVQVHLEDMRRGIHEHLVPGEGDVDFAAVLTALAAAGYAGPVCFELSRSSHMAPAVLETCREVWRRAAPSPRPAPGGET